MKTKLLVLSLLLAGTALGQITITDTQVVSAPVKTNTVTTIVRPVRYDLFYAYPDGTNRNARLIWRHVEGTNLTDVVNGLGKAKATFHRP